MQEEIKGRRKISKIFKNLTLMLGQYYRNGGFISDVEMLSASFWLRKDKVLTNGFPRAQRRHDEICEPVDLNNLHELYGWWSRRAV